MLLINVFQQGLFKPTYYYSLNFVDNEISLINFVLFFAKYQFVKQPPNANWKAASNAKWSYSFLKFVKGLAKN